MPTTWPFAALVVIAVALVVLAIIASSLCRQAMRNGDLIEADIKAASFRFNVRVHPAPRNPERFPPNNATMEPTAPDAAKNKPSPKQGQ